MYLADKTRFRGRQWVLLHGEPRALGFGPQRPLQEWTLDLPDDVGAGTYYLYAALCTADELEPACISSSKATKIAVAASGIEAIDIAGHLAAGYLDKKARPDWKRIRARIIQNRDALASHLYDERPGAIAEPESLASAFVGARQLPLEHGTVIYEPGPDFWLEERHKSDALEAHCLRIIQILMMAYDRSSNRDYLRAAVSYYLDWLEHNHIDSFTSALAWNDHATALRLQSMLMLLVRVVDLPDNRAIVEKLVRDVFRHGGVLSEWGFYSSWSNHGLYQNHALLAAAALVDVIEQANRWRSICLKRTTKWMDDKVGGDGVLNEGSAVYQFIVLRLLLQIRGLARHGGHALPVFDESIAKMVAFATFLIKPGGENVQFGDGYVWDEPPRGRVFADPVAGPIRERLQAEGPWRRSAVFVPSGYFFFVDDQRGLDADSYLAFDFGTSTKATHFQDDTLNFELMLNGVDLIQDSGLYDYSTDPLNEYYRSPCAHSTIVPDGRDAVDCRLRRIAETSLVQSSHCEELIEVEARMQTADGAEVVRSIAFHREGPVVVLRDRVEGASGRPAVAYFQYGEQLGARKVDRGILLFKGAQRFVHNFPGRETRGGELVRGQVEPRHSGWVSAHSREKTPRWTARVVFEPGSTGLVSAFAPAGIAPDSFPFGEAASSASQTDAPR